MRVEQLRVEGSAKNNSGLVRFSPDWSGLVGQGATHKGGAQVSCKKIARVQSNLLEFGRMGFGREAVRKMGAEKWELKLYRLYLVKGGTLLVI